MRALSALAAGAICAGLFALPAHAGDEQKLTITFSGPPQVTVTEDPLSGETTFSGTVTGTVGIDSPTLLAGAAVDCAFDGYTFEARSFSCGFIEAESVTGQCVFATGADDIAVAEWRCETGAAMTGDARCEGVANWAEGTGIFSGLEGSAKIHSDLFLYPSLGTVEWKGRWNIPLLAQFNS